MAPALRFAAVTGALVVLLLTVRLAWNPSARAPERLAGGVLPPTVSPLALLVDTAAAPPRTWTPSAAPTPEPTFVTPVHFPAPRVTPRFDRAPILLRKAEVYTERGHLSAAARARVPAHEGGQHRGYYAAPAGQEHYALLCYLVRQLRVGEWVVEVGAALGLSALALACNPDVPVFSFDLVQNQLHAAVLAHLNMSAPEYRAGVPNAFFIEADVMAPEYAHALAGASLILLDTYHEPVSRPFEYAFVKHLRALGYRGLLVADDTRLNAEMATWWTWLIASGAPDGAPAGDGMAYDLTDVGHASGTGLQDFGHRLKVLVN